MELNDFKHLCGAIMITGPEGTGVDDYAREAAGIILDCKDVMRHPDYLEVAPSGKVGYKLEDLAEMRSSFGLLPTKADKRVFVIRCAHKLTGMLQDTLLKTLEDVAGESTVVILSTTDVASMLDTVVSRCIVVKTDFTLEKNNMRVTLAATKVGASPDEVLFACLGRGEWLDEMSENGALMDIIASLRIIADDKVPNKELLRTLHLLKEKDEKNFFSYGRASVKALLLTLHKVYTLNRVYHFVGHMEQRPIYTFEHDEMRCNKGLKAIEEALDKIDILTSNDLLSVIMALS